MNLYASIFNGPIHNSTKIGNKADALELEKINDGMFIQWYDSAIRMCKLCDDIDESQMHHSKQRNHTLKISFLWHPRKDKTRGTEYRSAVARDLGGIVQL